jgi:hypothetical protein
MPKSPTWPRPSRFSDQNFMCISQVLMCAAHPIHLTVIDIIISKMLGAEYKVCSSTSSFLSFFVSCSSYPL